MSSSLNSIGSAPSPPPRMPIHVLTYREEGAVILTVSHSLVIASVSQQHYVVSDVYSALCVDRRCTAQVVILFILDLFVSHFKDNNYQFNSNVTAHIDEFISVAS